MSKWKRASMDSIKKHYDNIGKGDRASILKPGVKSYLMSAGDHCLRALPPVKEEYFGRDIYIHPAIGMGKDNFLCIGRDASKCPICAEAARLQKAGAPKEEFIPLMPKKKVLFNIVDLDKPSDGVQIWIAPYSVADEIARLNYNRKTKKLEDISDPDTGCNFFITREGIDIGTKYKGIARDDPSPVDDKFLEAIFDYDTILVTPDPNDMIRALGGDSDEERVERTDDFDAEESRPSRKEVEEGRPARRETRRGTPDPDAEEEKPSLMKRVREEAEKRYGGGRSE